MAAACRISPLRPFHVVRLRAFDVGGRTKLPMKDLVATCEAEGGTAVRSYAVRNWKAVRELAEMASGA